MDNGPGLPAGDLGLFSWLGMAGERPSVQNLAGEKEKPGHGCSKGARPCRLQADLSGLENRQGRYSSLRQGLRVKGLADPHSREVVLA